MFKYLFAIAATHQLGLPLAKPPRISLKEITSDRRRRPIWPLLLQASYLLIVIFYFTNMLKTLRINYDVMPEMWLEHTHRDVLSEKMQTKSTNKFNYYAL